MCAGAFVRQGRPSVTEQEHIEQCRERQDDEPDGADAVDLLAAHRSLPFPLAAHRSNIRSTKGYDNVLCEVKCKPITGKELAPLP